MLWWWVERDCETTTYPAVSSVSRVMTVSAIVQGGEMGGDWAVM